MEQPELEREVFELARRVAVLEERLGLEGQTVHRPAAVEAGFGTPRLETDPTEMVPVLGRALLGLAGAYLLRALTESGTMPGNFGVVAGIFYAVAWLVWAARTPAERRIEAAIHSLTAALVLAPLLWEATLRFHAVPTWMAGAVLLFFTVFGLAVSWKKNLLIVATISMLAGAGTAGALLMASRDVLPFTYVFLAIAAAVEVSACLDHWLSERWLAASAANLSVLLATWLVTNERGLPQGYAPIPHGWLLAAQTALLAIYLASIIVRTLLRHFTFSAFETAQCAIVFLIAVGGGLRLTPWMAIPAVLCGAACYVVSFALLERQGRNRNFYTYSTFGILLVIAGSRILLTGLAAPAAWGALALLCLWAGGTVRSLTLQVHGGAFLLIALSGAGAFGQAMDFLLGSATWPAQSGTAMIAALTVAVLAYAVTLLRPAGEPANWNSRMLRCGIAATVAWLAAGTLAGIVTGAYHQVFGAAATHAYCATLRTGILAGGALLLARMAATGRITECAYLVYPTMVLGAYRLLAQDLRQDRTPALFLSLAVYGAALILLPRMHRPANARSV